MCGIAGAAGGPPPDEAMLARMASAMTHRGPDAQGVWHDGRAGLAFRRLAIIDLEERSNQPLHLGPLHLVFNGEIYDYVELRRQLEGLGHAFHTEGDGEVLLHAWDEWGEGALDRVNAMFACAVWDDRDGSLTLAADPFGEKPLYWARDGERLVFASDIRALREALPAVPPPDDEALAAFVALGALPEPEDSFFAGVHRLPGAHRLRFAGGRVDVARYWTPERVPVPDRYEDAVAELRSLLLDAIRIRLRSDVPVGTSLSGGVDSSAIVCLSAELAGDHRRHAFTARFPGFERDEWPYAHEVAQAAGVLEHHAIEPVAADVVRDAEALVRDQEEPFGSLSIYAQWRVNRCAKEAGITVLLDGQGADELFAGYDGLEPVIARSDGIGATVRSLRASPAGTATTLLAGRVPTVVGERLRRRSAAPYATADAAERAARRRPVGASWARAGATPLHGELLRQSFASSLPGLLRYADRDSMAHSREVRLPFLDRRIAEFALSAPAGFLRRDGVSKAVLRDAVRGVVPARVLDRTDKVGFEPPQARWLAEPAVRDWAAGVLLDPGARAGAVVDRGAVEADVRAGAWSDHAALWRALNAELWLREFA